MNLHELTLRPANPDDKPFLLQLYIEQHRDTLVSSSGDKSQFDAILETQFNIQHFQFQQQYREADFNLILAVNQPVGQCIVEKKIDEFRLVDIAILPGYRGRGIGAAIIENIQREASASNAPVRLQVAVGNPAQRLYERLGFIPIGTTDTHVLMEWSINPK